MSGIEIISVKMKTGGFPFCIILHECFISIPFKSQIITYNDHVIIFLILYELLDAHLTILHLCSDWSNMSKCKNFPPRNKKND